MANYAIIHTSTRVIRRLTSVDPPEFNLNETAISVPAEFTLQGAPWKLQPDNISTVKPTQQEIDDSGVDPDRVALKRKQLMDDYIASIEAIIADLTIPARIRTVFSKLFAIINYGR